MGAFPASWDWKNLYGFVMTLHPENIPFFACSWPPSRHFHTRVLTHFTQPNCSLTPCQAFYIDRKPGRDFRSRANTSDPACSHLPWPKDVHKTGGFGSRIPSRFQVGAAKKVIYFLFSDFIVGQVRHTIRTCTKKTHPSREAPGLLWNVLIFGGHLVLPYSFPIS